MSRRALAWRGAQLALLGIIAVGVYRAVAASLSQHGMTAAELVRWPIEPVRLVASTVLLLAVYLAHAALWRRIMTDLGIARPDAGTTLRVYFLASLGRYIPGRLWQLAGLAVLAQRAGLPAAPAAAAAVIGQLGFLTTGLVFLALTLPGWGGGAAVWIATAALVAAACGAWLLLASRAGHPLRRRISRAVAETRAGRQLALALQMTERARPRQALLWAAGYAATWVLLGAAFALFATAFAPATSGAIRHLAGTVAAAYLAGYIAIFAPGGIIVREGAMTVLLSEIMPAPAALVIAVASRLWFTAAELLPLAALPVLPGAPARAP